MKQLLCFFVMLIIVSFMSCSINEPIVNNNIIKPEVVKPGAYNTTILLFYSNYDKRVVKKVIKIPIEIPMNFTTKTAYNEVFPWSEYICEIRFSESKNSLPFYSIFAFYNYSKILAIAIVDSVDTTKRLKERAMFWVYDKDGNPIRATIKEFKRVLNVIEIKPTEPV